MKIIQLPIENLREAAWNPNSMSASMMTRLKQSIKRFGLVSNLVVRGLYDGDFEVLSGNQRLKLLTEMGFKRVPCVVVDVDDAHARLLSQALNRIQGDDDLGLKAELLREVLENIPEDEINAVLPESTANLKTIATMGQETIANYLRNWQQAQAARLRHLQFQLTDSQLEVIEEAIARVLPRVKKKSENPNSRGNALFLLCKSYLEKYEGE